MLKTLAIETSCDDTSIWIIQFNDGIFSVESILAYSQIVNHQKYWWVVPEIASRLHQEKIVEILRNLWYENINKVDFISVTSSPWLPWSLMVWTTSASMLWEFLWKNVISVNHIVWHILSIFLDRNIGEISFPMAVLTASWGHNEIYIVDMVENSINFQKLGQTLDDAAWECFDKVSRMLWWPYPGWVWISENAEKWKYNEMVKFNRIFLKSDEYNFSFSGMKSQVYYLLKKFEEEWVSLNEQLIYDICFEFQESVVEVLANKLIKAAINNCAKTIAITWWVSANDRLYQVIDNWILKIANKRNIKFDLIRPTKKLYSTDNAAMIWVVWIFKEMWYEINFL